MSDIRSYIIIACCEHDRLADADEEPERRAELARFVERAEKAEDSGNVWQQIAVKKSADLLRLT